MPCYKPLKGFPVGVTANGKVDYKVTSYSVHHIDIIPGRGGTSSRQFIYVTDQMILSGYRTDPRCTEQISYFVELPCGQCEGCRLRYSRMWADRCMLELQSHDEAYFVTLTYNDDNLVYTSSVDDSGDMVSNGATLCKRDFQLFMKRLRKAVEPQKLRFFASGEYGEKSFRPHYHAIIFGLHLEKNDLQFYKSDPSGSFNYYKSDFLAGIWQKGFVVVGKVTWETCAYTARYVMKKLKGPEAQLYSDLGIEPPFSLMSRKPGLAREYYDTHPELFDYDNIPVSTANGGKKLQIPRYFDTLLEVDNPVLAKERKEKRQLQAQLAKEAMLAQTDLPYLEALEVKRLNKVNSLKKLKREL